eukprot:838685-Prymnesium_polylepis.1
MLAANQLSWLLLIVPVALMCDFIEAPIGVTFGITLAAILPLAVCGASERLPPRPLPPSTLLPASPPALPCHIPASRAHATHSNHQRTRTTRALPPSCDRVLQRPSLVHR